MNFNFIITEGNKNKARKIRIHNEKKWLIPKIVMGILLIMSAATVYTGITAAIHSDFKKLAAAGIVFVISLVAALILIAAIKNLASHWIQDRLNERLKIDEYLLYHFVSFASGLNSRKADSSGCIFVFELYTIRNAKYDEKSKRIEFIVDGTGYHYSGSDKNVDKEWPLKGYEAVFYDYYQPSLIETLKLRGIKVEKQPLNSYPVFYHRIR